MRRIDPKRAVAGLVALLLAVAGCSGPGTEADAGPSSSDPAPSSEEAPPSDQPDQLEPPADDGDAPAPVAGSSSSERLTLRPDGTVDGAPLGYAEYLPPGYGDGDAAPLLVFLHGSDEAGFGTEGALGRLFVHGLPALIQESRWPDDRPFVVLMPQYGTERTQACQLGDDIAAFLDFALDHYDIDDTRVYLTGVSCGASGIWYYLAEHGDEVVAAAVPIAGRAARAFSEAGCELGRIPLWVFHGEDDDLVPTAGVVPAVTQLQACADPAPMDVRLTVYPGVGHESWDQTYDLSAGHDVYAWLLEHRRA